MKAVKKVCGCGRAFVDESVTKSRKFCSNACRLASLRVSRGAAFLRWKAKQRAERKAVDRFCGALKRTLPRAMDGALSAPVVQAKSINHLDTEAAEAAARANARNKRCEACERAFCDVSKAGKDRFCGGAVCRRGSERRGELEMPRRQQWNGRVLPVGGQ